MGHRVETPWPILNNFPSKRAPVSPLSIGLHLVTPRQKQKVAVLFTKVSTLTPKNVQSPAPWADHPRTTSFPSLVLALPWAKISRRSHHPALRYPQPYKQKKQTYVWRDNNAAFRVESPWAPAAEADDCLSRQRPQAVLEQSCINASCRKWVSV